MTAWRNLTLSTLEETLVRLGRSDFRAKFRLSDKDKDYVREKGIDKIREHCEQFVRERLSPAIIPNDGRQTPMRGHPVFIAQHACACCCRGCLEKWYRVKRDMQLSPTQEKKIVDLLMYWIEKQMDKGL